MPLTQEVQREVHRLHEAGYIERQAALIPPDRLTLRAALIGAGAIGSWAGLLLAKMGYAGPLRVFDGDEVDNPNIGTQAYGRRVLGWNKAYALRNAIYRQTRRYVQIKMQMVGEGWRLPYDLLIVAVDTMKARQDVLTSYLRYRHHAWVIEARMGAEVLALYTVNTAQPEHLAAYQRTLHYTDDEAVQEPCAMTGTAYTGAIAGALIAQQVKRVCLGEPYSQEVLLDIHNLTLTTSAQITTGQQGR